jgi:hypothetical protein
MQGAGNRLGAATASLLRHPQRAADLLAFLDQFRIRVLAVPTSRAGWPPRPDQAAAPTGRKGDGGERSESPPDLAVFMAANGLRGDCLARVAAARLEEGRRHPDEAFAYHCAVALCELSQKHRARSRSNVHLPTQSMIFLPASLTRQYSVVDPARSRRLFYSSVYGAAVISHADSWGAARAALAAAADAGAGPEDPPEARGRRERLRREVDLLGDGEAGLPSVPVVGVSFELDGDGGLRVTAVIEGY